MKEGATDGNRKDDNGYGIELTQSNVLELAKSHNVDTGDISPEAGIGAIEEILARIDSAIEQGNFTEV